MAWEVSLVTMVRNLINDLGSTEEFTDARIESAIATAAMITIGQFTFEENEYVVDLDTPDITPDPTDSSTYDPLAIALFSLKAACILDIGRLQDRAKNTGIKIRDGDSEVTTANPLIGYDSVLTNGPCGSYNKLMEDSYWRLHAGKGKAVSSPYGYGEGSTNYSSFWEPRVFFDYYFRR